VSDQSETPTNRSGRLADKTKPRGSIALEESLWDFVQTQKAKTGLSANAVYRKALSNLKAAEEESSSVPSASLQEDDAAAKSLAVGSVADLKSHIQIPEIVSEKLGRLRLLNALRKKRRETFWLSGASKTEPTHDHLSEFEALEAELTPLQAELVALFLPLLTQLVQSGLLQTHIVFDDSITSSETCEAVIGEPTHAFKKLDGELCIFGKQRGGILREK
jgi:hypothetical protein